jgi:hypothetical protein
MQKNFNDYIFKFTINQKSKALIQQIRFFDSKRFIKKIGKISIVDFKLLKQKNQRYL